MKGIRVQWTVRREERLQAHLTFDQVRDRFGLGGTPDELVRIRLGKIASWNDIRGATEALTQPSCISRAADQLSLGDIRTVEMPEPVPDPEPCCAHCCCKGK